MDRRPVVVLLLALHGLAVFAQPTNRVGAETAADVFHREAAARYRAILSGLRERHVLDDDEAMLRRVHPVAYGLIAAATAERPESAAWSWEVHVTSDPKKGAFCMAVGKVLIGSALVRRLALDDGELAMLLAHEMAHALAEHRREVAGGAIDTDATLEARQAERAISQEIEADRIGMSLAYRAGWPLASLVRFYH